MPFNAGDFYADVPAGNIAIRRFQRDTNFVAYQMCPRMMVNKPEGIYYRWKMGDLNRDEMQERGYRAPARVGRFTKDSDTFKVNIKSLAYDLNDVEAQAADVQINPETMIPKALAYKTLISAERMIAAAMFTSTAWYRTVTGAGSPVPNRGAATGTRGKLNDQTVDPIATFLEEIEDQGLRTGFEPTGAVFGRSAWTAFRSHQSVRAALTTLGKTVVRNQPASLEEACGLLELKYIGVSRAIYNTKLDGDSGDPTNARIIPTDSVLLYFRTGDDASDPGLYDNDEPAACARVVWGAGAGNDSGIRIRKFRDEKAGAGGSDHSEIDAFHTYKVITPDMGTFFTGMI
jgi:Phage major capsid protein E